MIFHVLKIIKPVWYYHLLGLPPEQLVGYADPDYNTTEANKAEQFWNLLQTTIKLPFGQTPEYVPDLTDNYLFLKKHFSPLQSVYVLIIRLICLNPPVREIRAFLQARRKTITPKEKAPLTTSPNPDQTVPDQPVSIVIPTLNRYDYLAKLLDDLTRQDFQNFEVIVIDQSEPFRSDFYAQFKLDLRVVRQPHPGLWQARNTGIIEAQGEIVVFSEDDVRVEKNWLYSHLVCLEHFQADISTGIFFPPEQRHVLQSAYFKLAEQFSGGNSAVRKKVFKKTGLFDRQFEKGRMGDGEFGLRAQQAGFLSISNPLAFCIDAKAPTGGLRQMGAWDAFRPGKILAPRPIPSVLYFFRRYFPKENVRLAILQGMLSALVPYRHKHNKKWRLLGALLAIPAAPLLLWQLYRSWQISSRMIAEGPKIDPFPESSAHH